MGIDFNALVRYDYISFFFAILVIITALLYLRHGALREEEKLTLWVVHVLAFVFLSGVIMMFGILWAWNIMKEFNMSISSTQGSTQSSTFINPNADWARLLYETKTILGYSEAIIVASISIFLPLLMGLWHSFTREMMQTLTNLKTMENSPHIQQDQLNQTIEMIIQSITKIEKFGQTFRIPFGITIFFSLVLIMTIAISLFLFHGVLAYIVATLLGAMSLILFLWFLTLLSIFVSLVLPIERKHKLMQVSLLGGSIE